jgi:hypothetical protein
VKPPEFVLTRSCWITIEAGDPAFHSTIDAHLVGDLQYFESSSADAGLDEEVDVHVAFDPNRPQAGLLFEGRVAPMPP